MGSKVALVEFGEDLCGSLEKALDLIGKIDDLNTSKRSVVVKVGVFDPNAENHATDRSIDFLGLGWFYG